MEKYKYLEPKLSGAFGELVEYFGDNREENRGTSRSDLQSLSNMGVSEPVHSVHTKIMPTPPPIDHELNIIQ